MRPDSSPHTAISEMQMYIFTPPQALTSYDDTHTHTHTHTHTNTHIQAHTSVREDLSMGGLSVSMVTEAGIYCMCWGACSVCEQMRVCIVSLCVSLTGSRPKTDCRPGTSPIAAAVTFTQSTPLSFFFLMF